MRKLLLAALLAGCSRAPDAAPGAAVYEAVDRGFSVQAPADWRVQESDGGTHRAGFFGPAGDAFTVYRYGPKSALPTIESYVAAKSMEGPPSPQVKASVAGKEAIELSFVTTLTGPHFPEGRLRLLNRAFLVADGDGYWALVHSWPEKSKPNHTAFEAFVGTFRPTSDAPKR
jgi:hypothetical protein